MEEDEVEVEMDEEECEGEAEEMGEAAEAMEERRDGGVVKEDGRETGKLMMDSGDVKADEEEEDRGTEEEKGADEFKGDVVAKERIGKGAEDCAGGKCGGMETGEGVGRAGRAEAVLYCFFMEDTQEAEKLWIDDMPKRFEL